MLKVDRTAGRSSALLGESNFIGVERGIAEFRAARPVAICSGAEAILVLPVDGIDDARLDAFRQGCLPSAPSLVLTARRARAIGIDTRDAVALPVTPHDDVRAVAAIATKARLREVRPHQPVHRAAAAALDLAKLAHRLPAVIAAAVDPARLPAFDPPIVRIDAEAVGQFRDLAIASLTRASEAPVPLQGGIRARFVIFRGMLGGEQAAIIVNEPDFSKPVPVRLHSACLTGDVFGSRRCDCGDQLRLALKQIADSGGGVVLYLDQEGRGVGLANKMRAYELQDAGLDTVDANIALGFDDDERDYGIAGRMLEMIGCRQVMLLTNNPAKIDGLALTGIEIAGRIPLLTPVNGDNRRYLAAKAMRAGHSLDHLFDVLNAKEPSVVPDAAGAS